MTLNEDVLEDLPEELAQEVRTTHENVLSIEEDNGDEAEGEETEEQARVPTSPEHPGHLNQASNPQDTNAGDLPEDIRQVLEDDITGEIWAADHIENTYADVDQGTAAEIEDILTEELNSDDGWSVQSLTDTLEQTLDARTGIDNPRARARTIARTETASVISEARKRRNEQLALERPDEQLFTVQGADDSRTTKMSYWIRQEVGDGVPHDELIDILDEAVSLAKDGAFTENGQHGNIHGEPIELPSDFSRRGYVTHFNDRDRVERVVR